MAATLREIKWRGPADFSDYYNNELLALVVDSGFLDEGELTLLSQELVPILNGFSESRHSMELRS